jgi:hypothetical protein
VLALSFFVTRKAFLMKLFFLTSNSRYNKMKILKLCVCVYIYIYIYIYVYVYIYIYMSCLGGVVVSVLANGPKGCSFEPGQGNGFLRAIKIRSKPFSRMGSKAGKSHVVRFYGM